MAAGVKTVRGVEQRKKNLRLALILTAVAAIFFVGFVARIALSGR